MRKWHFLIPLLLIPALVGVNAVLLKEEYYAACACLIAVATCVLVMLGFDKSKTNVRRSLLIGVMTALSVAGRFMFAFVPAFKPMTAMIVLTGVYLGPEAGFFCGAFTAFLSNFYFAQGPWTPFQMVAFGLIGFVAGLCGRVLQRKGPLLVLYGALAGLCYSMIMDVWTVLWYNEGMNGGMYLASFVAALPFTVLYMVSNVVFLLVLRKPFGRKLERMVNKHGI